MLLVTGLTLTYAARLSDALASDPALMSLSLSCQWTKEESMVVFTEDRWEKEGPGDLKKIDFDKTTLLKFVPGKFGEAMVESHWLADDFKYGHVVDGELDLVAATLEGEANQMAVRMTSGKTFRADLVFVRIDRTTGYATKNIKIKVATEPGIQEIVIKHIGNCRKYTKQF
jgi:hypothetical protein